MSETNKYLTIMNKQKNGKALHLEHAAEEICFESLTVKDQEKLQEFGINPSSIPEEVYSIDCSSLNRVWHGNRNEKRTRRRGVHQPDGDEKTNDNSSQGHHIATF